MKIRNFFDSVMRGHLGYVLRQNDYLNAAVMILRGWAGTNSHYVYRGNTHVGRYGSAALVERLLLGGTHTLIEVSEKRRALADVPSVRFVREEVRFFGRYETQEDACTFYCYCKAPNWLSNSIESKTRRAIKIVGGSYERTRALRVGGVAATTTVRHP